MYQNYKNARDIAWQTLIDCKINSLPVRLSSIAKHYKATIKSNSEVGILNDIQLGCVSYSGDGYSIIVDTTVSLERQRYTIAHEIGHIALKHSLEDAILLRTETQSSTFLTYTSAQEYEAERFAMNLLAPACVLYGLDIHTTKDISQLCCISEQSAKKRADRMRTLYKRNKFLTSKLEQQVYRQFQRFISENR